jgi:hypothetical protein
MGSDGSVYAEESLQRAERSCLLDTASKHAIAVEMLTPAHERETGVEEVHVKERNALGMTMIFCASLCFSGGSSMVTVIGDRVPSLQTAFWYTLHSTDQQIA